MKEFPASHVFARISVRFAASHRDGANLLRKRCLASLVICNITSPLVAKGKEKLHI